MYDLPVKPVNQKEASRDDDRWLHGHYIALTPAPFDDCYASKRNVSLKARTSVQYLF